MKDGHDSQRDQLDGFVTPFQRVLIQDSAAPNLLAKSHLAPRNAERHGRGMPGDHSKADNMSLTISRRRLSRGPCNDADP